MSPTIRVRAASGRVGMIISAIITVVMFVIGVTNTESPPTACTDASIGQCVGQVFGNAIGETIAAMILILAVFALFLVIVC
jgi:hypothetical protein